MTDGASLTGNVSFVSREQVTCQLPNSGIYNVSVSNDGNSFGAELTYIGYDSSCYSCDLSGCSQRVGQNCDIESPLKCLFLILLYQIKMIYKYNTILKIEIMKEFRSFFKEITVLTAIFYEIYVFALIILYM